MLVSYLRALDPTALANAPTNASGQSVFVPCLMDDRLHEVVEIVCRLGGSAMIVAVEVVRDGVQLHTAHVLANDSVGGTDHDCHVPIGPACTLGDIVRVLAPGASMTLRLTSEELVIKDVEALDLDERAAELVGA